MRLRRQHRVVFPTAIVASDRKAAAIGLERAKPAAGAVLRARWAVQTTELTATPESSCLDAEITGLAYTCVRAGTSVGSDACWRRAVTVDKFVRKDVADETAGTTAGSFARGIAILGAET